MMRKIHIIIILLVLFSSLENFSQNYLTFTPTNQNVTTNSGEEIIVSVRVNCFGGQSGSVSLFVNPFSIPDNGYQSYSIKGGTSILYPGNVRNIEFKFKRTISNNVSTTYKFDTDYYNNVGTLVKKRITINVSYNIVDSDGDGVPDSQDSCPNNPGPSSNNGCPICNLSAPTNSYESDITFNSVKLNWNSVSSAISYNIQYRESSSGSLIDRYTSSLNYNLSALKANTSYDWRIRSRCSHNSYGFWSPLYTFKTLEECEINKDLYGTTNSNENILVEVSNNINSFIKIESGANVNYSAGNQVQLSTSSSGSFKAEIGSTFRAFIEGCSAISNKTGKRSSKISTKNVEEELKNNFTIYPNPSTGIFYLSTNNIISNYKVINQIGKTILENKTSNNNFKVSLQKYPSGVYFIQLQFENGEIEMKKIIKQ
jgi:hypothetical protein